MLINIKLLTLILIVNLIKIFQIDNNKADTENINSKYYKLVYY